MKQPSFMKTARSILLLACISLFGLNSGLAATQTFIDNQNSRVVNHGLWDSVGTQGAIWDNLTMAGHTYMYNGPGAGTTLATDNVAFTFTGRSVSVMLFKNVQGQKANIYLDGALIKTVDTYAPSAVKKGFGGP